MRANRLLFVVPAIAGMVFAVVFQMQGASAEQYLVQDGDTLSQVASRLGVSVEALAGANGISDPNFIVSGSLLVVPADGRHPTEYLVQDGDTLWAIAQKVGVPVSMIAKANGLVDPDYLPAGKLLTVPPPGATADSVATSPAATGASTSYTVKAGDNLASIAATFGVSVRALADANGISDPNYITVGQVLTAPNAWQCPVPSASFVNDFGYVNDQGWAHQGVDLFADRGTPVLAPVGGLVERYPNPSGGNAIELYGNDGNRYYMAHFNEYGDSGRVAAGTIVGYVGNTGDARTTSTHVHFEIHPGGGSAVNPYPTLVSACR